MDRRLFLLGLLAVASPSLAAVQPPRDLIQKFYLIYEAEGTHGTGNPVEKVHLRDWMTDDLRALYDKGTTTQPGEEMPILDFDPFIDAQDYEITEVAVTTKMLDKKRQLVTAAFKNIGTPTVILFDFVLTKKGWRISDVRYPVTKDRPGGFSLKSFLKTPLI
ncbi:DUF3828 domain-containing protein [Asticcacaulis sp. YBE204]|uniref:DUF3828 domain-containing protein n=1 Tax=Asticcacaulis sp. YBE204 TaxID=1282363 RepID=UPI0003C3CB3E|nr:DUF3828 domain-containing protein [Asticcacaulis sp. YBE204]ESQ80861.1 hypothetical protein AEYBE204_00645 [Asticcacaulis sp. YBE204]